ncbi:Malonyl-[acyl-carrier protein] O-methyltransferase [Defluviimonas aquaemixtae]|uniref:Malonyl-[acyl-carrier protein] O-methyltransferase n=1 Tax=Albidovulum aquaemixtae TaxID=1542388 RepID=A0A2R8BJX7_9RHOB|nr:class I SAM-dependent methyltransferase [Defluviimonas aquaemixtae]SPH23648.1 Malonyl-[acyl-carrier protein] O-methyltransferase [Defluviimonas aquaemixtae]
MTDDEHDLDGAYALRTPADSVRYYRDWAASYDSDFAEAMSYQSPAVIAAAYVALGGQGPVLDVGAGTGLVGESLAEAGIGPVDGLDISAEMLETAAEKGVYRRTIVGDLTRELALGDAAYAGCVSAGTFTTGHVGPEAFDELLRVTRPGGIFAVTVHGVFYETAGFAAHFAGLADRIAGFRTEPFRIYGPGAEGEHRDDSGWVVSFRKS